MEVELAKKWEKFLEQLPEREESSDDVAMADTIVTKGAEKTKVVPQVHFYILDTFCRILKEQLS